MNQKVVGRLGALALGGMSALCAADASAHIDMVGPVTSRGGDQKMSPCDGAARGTTVFTFEPGATISLGVSEGVSHPSYFRIAFDNDGSDGFKEPATIDPIDPNRACPINADDQCKKGQPDFCNVISSTGGATVLWDNLDPHIPAIPVLPGPQWKWTITLPNVECNNCTLQVLQVMEDDNLHGPYCPQGGSCNTGGSLEDIYHRCIDIVLKKGAGMTPGTVSTPATNKGVNCAGATPTADGGVAVDGSVPVVILDGGTLADAGVNPVFDSGAVTGNPPPLTGADGAVLPAADGGAVVPGAGNGAAGEDDGGCSVRPGAHADGAFWSLALASAAVWLGRRRRKHG